MENTFCITAIEDESSPVGLIMGIVVAVLFIAGIVVFVLLVLKRRAQQKSNMYRHQPGEQLTNRLSLSNRRSW